MVQELCQDVRDVMGIVPPEASIYRVILRESNAACERAGIRFMNAEMGQELIGVGDGKLKLKVLFLLGKLEYCLDILVGIYTRS